MLSAVCFVFFSQPTVTDECYFLEKLEENHYNTYLSQRHQERSWYVALKKNGKPKLGPRTHIGQKAIFFLPRQLSELAEWRSPPPPPPPLNTQRYLDPHHGCEAAAGWILFKIHLFPHFSSWTGPEGDMKKWCENGWWEKKNLSRPKRSSGAWLLGARTSYCCVQILVLTLKKMHQS